MDVDWLPDKPASSRTGGRARSRNGRKSVGFAAPTDCSPSCLISRKKESEIAISDNKSLESRRK